MASTVEMLRSLVRQKDGELSALRERVQSLERVRMELTNEMVAMTTKLNVAEEDIKHVDAIKAQLNTLSVRHSAALQLIGEKEEELEDTRQDLRDVKQMFQTQSTFLLEEINRLKGSKQSSGEGEDAK